MTRQGRKESTPSRRVFWFWPEFGHRRRPRMVVCSLANSAEEPGQEGKSQEGKRCHPEWAPHRSCLFRIPPAWQRRTGANQISSKYQMLSGANQKQQKAGHQVLNVQSQSPKAAGVVGPLIRKPCLWPIRLPDWIAP